MSNEKLGKLRNLRSTEILAVFTRHNFYADGFTPEEMRTTLEDLGPTYVKLGQIMSSRTDILPESYCRELQKLRTNVRPLEAETVRAVIEQETGKKIDEIFSEFRDEPLGSASIAQAHYGVLKDGTRVVTKVQRPYIADTVRKDFILLKKFAAVVNVVTETEDGNKVVDFKSAIEQLEKVTEEELDFRVEAEHSRTFRRLCIEDRYKISCPDIIDELTTERILTQTFVDGYSLEKTDKIEADGIDHVRVGKAIVENYVHQVLDVGIFHGDPHQGNIMLSHGVPYWIDFGMIGQLNERDISMIEDIVLALLQKDSDRVCTIILAMGVANSEINKPKMIEDIDYLTERYLSMKDISGMDMGELLADLKNILAKHNITMPSRFTMLVRSLITIEGVLQEFCPELNLFDYLTQKMLRRLRENFDLREKLHDTMKEAVSFGLDAKQVPAALVNLLRNLSKGKLKVGFELMGYDDLVTRVQSTVKNLTLAVIACVLFIGSCMLCTTDIKPQANGIPFIAMIGFVISVALGIYAVGQLSRYKKK
ncbi:MAG: AarF/ABC1/UbiB kinase family protein [Ruminococcus sp.]|nr:AarF/ABC1/UbiB kinase family protein [Ruminococcus sp.]